VFAGRVLGGEREGLKAPFLLPLSLSPINMVPYPPPPPSSHSIVRKGGGGLKGVEELHSSLIFYRDCGRKTSFFSLSLYK